jgi:hypothetical protein
MFARNGSNTYKHIEPYVKAALNDVAYIREYIKNNKEKINNRCKFESQYGRSYSDKSAGGTFFASIIAACAFPPLAVPLTVTSLLSFGYLVSSHLHNTYYNLRQNWTMLDFAAESGATAVAMYLICEGADTNNNFFLELAKVNGHLDLFIACSILIESIKKMNSLSEEIARLNMLSVNPRIEYESTIIKLEQQKESLLSEIVLLQNENKELIRTLNEFEIIFAEEVISSPKVGSFGIFHNKTNSFPYNLTDKNNPYVPGDCFFDAVIINSSLTFNKYELRQRIYETLKSNPHIYENYFNIDKKYAITYFDEELKSYITDEITYATYLEFCEHVRQPGAWVDHVEIQAFCDTFNICCVIAEKNAKREPNVFGLRFSSEENQPIILGYVNNDHYVALKCPQDCTPISVLNEIQQVEKNNRMNMN